MPATAGAFSRRHRERRLHGARAIDEQAHRVEIRQRGGGDGRARIRERKRGQRIGRLAGDAQRLAARREHLEAGARLQEPVRELGARVDQVLAVVEHDEQASVCHELRQRVERRAAGLLDHTQHRRDRLSHEAAIGDRRELDEPDAVRVIVDDVRRSL